MKITSIIERLSGEDRIAIATEPPLDADVFLRFKTLYLKDHGLALFNVEFADGKLLFTNITVASVFPRGFGEGIERLLNEAETWARSTKRSLQQQADLKQATRKATLGAAAKAFGVPIQ